jgi:hypothetical protein
MGLLNHSGMSWDSCPCEWHSITHTGFSRTSPVSGTLQTYTKAVNKIKNKKTKGLLNHSGMSWDSYPCESHSFTHTGFVRMSPVSGTLQTHKKGIKKLKNKKTKGLINHSGMSWDCGPRESLSVTHKRFSRISPESGTFGTHKNAVNKIKNTKTKGLLNHSGMSWDSGPYDYHSLTHTRIARISPVSGTLEKDKKTIKNKKGKQKAYSITVVCLETVALENRIQSHTQGLYGFLLCQGPSKHTKAVNKIKKQEKKAHSITQVCRETVALMTTIHSHTQGS